MQEKSGIPLPSLRRLPFYYRRLAEALQQGLAVVSSEELGAAAGVAGAQVRRDLSYIREEGRPGIGYDARALASRLEEFLGLVNAKEAVLVGVGNLGRALASYSGFERYGLHIVALFDQDPAKVGMTVGDRQVLPMTKLTSLIARLRIQMGIITVPSCAAQDVADLMVGGVSASSGTLPPAAWYYPSPFSSRTRTWPPSWRPCLTISHTAPRCRTDSTRIVPKASGRCPCIRGAECLSNIGASPTGHAGTPPCRPYFRLRHSISMESVDAHDRHLCGEFVSRSRLG